MSALWGTTRVPTATRSTLRPVSLRTKLLRYSPRGHLGGMAVLSKPPSRADDRAWAVLERLAELERPPGSHGEGQAAELIAAELEARGARIRIERTRVHGTYWIPIGLACAAATVAGGLGARTGAPLAGLACASVTDDLEIGRRPLRRLLPRRLARNVIAEYGPAADAPTLVIHAHHDAARTGLVFHPGVAKLAARLAGDLIERAGGTPAPMWGAAAGPAAVALGQLLRSRRLRRLGTAISASYTAAMLDIWRSPAVPGANDNLSGVCALLVIASELASMPPERLRVVLLSTGSEESFLEAMVGFGERHFPNLPRGATTFLCLESIGSPQLMLLAGEGLLRLRHYPQDLIGTLTALAQQHGIVLRDPFRYRLATDGQVPLRAGYPTAVISSMDWYKAPSNYHWPTDVPRNLHRETICRAVRLAIAFIRALDQEHPG
jgi:Peptidase family M28